jgi:hypothetical protein
MIRTIKKHVNITFLCKMLGPPDTYIDVYSDASVFSKFPSWTFAAPCLAVSFWTVPETQFVETYESVHHLTIRLTIEACLYTYMCDRYIIRQSLIQSVNYCKFCTIYYCKGRCHEMSIRGDANAKIFSWLFLYEETCTLSRNAMSQIRLWLVSLQFFIRGAKQTAALAPWIHA